MTGNRHGKYRTISVHKLRRRARAERNRIQRTLAAADRSWPQRRSSVGTRTADTERAAYLHHHHLPAWVQGVHVAKAGPFQHQVIITEWRDRP